MSTLLKQICNVEEQLVFTLEYDDQITKTRVISKDDYVSIAFNSNGIRKVVNGTVANIYANKYADNANKRDWYIMVINDDMKNASAVRVGVWQILDIEILHTDRYSKHVSTPSNSMRVTDMRRKGNKLQISCNGGRSWLNVGSLTEEGKNDELITEDVTERINALIGPEATPTNAELVAGVTDIIKAELAKYKSCVSVSEELDDCHCPMHVPPYEDCTERSLF